MAYRPTLYLGECPILTPRKPRGFQTRDVPAGILYVQHHADGRWIILAGDPPIQIDNDHSTRIPHMHTHGWNTAPRRDLDPSLTAEQTANAIETHLEEFGYIDIPRLLEELR